MASRSRRWTATFALVVMTGVTGAFASVPPAAAAGAGETITVYNGQHPQTTADLVAAFEKQTGIKVLVRNGDEDVLANQIVQEGSGSPADVYYGENSPVLQFLQEKNLLAPVAPSTLSRVPSRDNSPKGDWVGVSARVSGFVYNTKLVRPGQRPTSVMNLANPKWSGKLGIAPGETDLRPVVTSVARARGQAAALRWLDGMRANAGSHSYPDNETLLSAVNSGQVAIGIIDNYYWYRLAFELGRPNLHSAFAYFAPGDAGYVVDVSGAAVLRSSHHQAAAQRFVAFLVSAKGEGIIAHSQSYEYPLGSGVRTAQPLRPFSQLHPAPLTVAELGDGQRAVLLLQEAQLL